MWNSSGMGLPQRLPSYRDSSSSVVAEQVEVRFSEVFDSRVEEEEEQGPWCVDLGDAIACLSTMQVWLALASRKVVPETKVWRDGMACWLPIADVPELTDEDDPASEQGRRSIPEKSEIRRRAVPLAKSPEPRARRRRYLVAASVLVGCLVGVVVFRVATEPPPVEPLRRVVVDVAERSRLLVDRVRDESVQRERAWWLSRWGRPSR